MVVPPLIYGHTDTTFGMRACSDAVRGDGKECVSEGKKSVSEGKKSVSEGKKSVSEGKKSVSEGKKCIERKGGVRKKINEELELKVQLRNGMKMNNFLTEREGREIREEREREIREKEREK